MGEGFSSEHVRLAEAIYRCEAHCLACCELYAVGRRPDALLQAARPITDVLPWLETEFRSYSELRPFMSAIATMGREVRGEARPRHVRRALDQVCKARAALMHEALGDRAEDDAFRSSVALVLLDAALDRYSQGVGTAGLGDYQSAYGSTRMAVELLRTASMEEVLGAELSLLVTAFPSVEPPAELVRPATVAAAIERIREVATVRFGELDAGGRLGEGLGTVERLLDEVVENYERGVAPLAARLAASLFVRSYDPLRGELAVELPSIEERLTPLLAEDLRRLINDGAPVHAARSVAGEVRELLASARRILDEDVRQQSVSDR